MQSPAPRAALGLSMAILDDDEKAKLTPPRAAEVNIVSNHAKVLSVFISLFFSGCK